jgi:predicted Zn finger-like uncharacterized protein
MSGWLAAPCAQKLRSPMTETFKCPHCGAMYEITREKSVPHGERDATNCQICGQQMQSNNSSSIRGYELVRMPDGTSV